MMTSFIPLNLNLCIIFSILLTSNFLKLLTAQTIYRMVWDQNYCTDTTRYPSNIYQLPRNAPCPICIDDTIILTINTTGSANHYENFYRVPSEQAMMNCNASINGNGGSVLIIMDTLEFLIRNRGSNTALGFFETSPATVYYFISTSSGSETSANNDLLGRPGNCLQLALLVVAKSSDCDNYGSCPSISILTNTSSDLGCTTVTTSTTIPTISPTATQSSTVSTPAITTIPNTMSTTQSPTTSVTTMTTTMVTSSQPIVTTNTPINTIVFVASAENSAAIAGWSFLLSLVILAIIIVTPGGPILLFLYWKGIFPFCCAKQNYSPENIGMSSTAKRTEDNVQPISASPKTESKFTTEPESHYENLPV